MDSKLGSPDSSDTEEEGTTEENRHKPNKLTLEAGDLTVKAESFDETVAELAVICHEQMDHQMRFYTLGEMEMIEQENLFPIIFGD